MQFTQFILRKIIQESQDVRTFMLSLPDSSIPDFIPGNFFLLALNDGNGKRVQRAYSIASVKSEGALRFIIKLKGVFTTLLWQKKEGETIEVSGPYGIFKLKDTDTERVFIGGGVGISPLRSMIIQTLSQGKKATLFQSAKTNEELVYYVEFESLSKENSLFTFYPALTRETPSGWCGLCERISADLIKRTIGTLEGKSYYLCGSKEMMASVAQSLIDAGVPKENVHKEEWG